MHIERLHLKNIGPFNEADIYFPRPNDNQEFPVTIFTGENGTGKSIIIDAIRTLFMSYWGIERNVIANKEDFKLSMEIFDQRIVELKGTPENLNSSGKLSITPDYGQYFVCPRGKTERPEWIIDYWNTDSSTDDFKLESLKQINIDRSLENALLKEERNIDLQKFIVAIDYIRGSDNEEERRLGELVYAKMISIINSCLDHGKFIGVRRRDFSTRIDVLGHDVSLDKLSSGNIMLLKHFTKLVSWMYSVCLRNKWPIEHMFEIPGILLIDEIENHLHPKWQKKVLSIIQEHFPKLQIILTTHSPFVISSVKNPKIYLCKSMIDHSEIEDVSGDFYGMPVDEVLNALPFDVRPFNEEITRLLAARSKAISEDNLEMQQFIEKKLIELNESYFSIYNRVYQ